MSILCSFVNGALTLDLDVVKKKVLFKTFKLMSVQSLGKELYYIILDTIGDNLKYLPG